MIFTTSNPARPSQLLYCLWRSFDAVASVHPPFLSFIDSSSGFDPSLSDFVLLDESRAVSDYDVKIVTLFGWKKIRTLWNFAGIHAPKCFSPSVLRQRLKHSVFFTMDVRSFHVYCGGVARLPDIFNTWEISVIVLLSLKESLILILWYILKLNYLSIINKELINCPRFIQWEAQVGKVIIPN